MDLFSPFERRGEPLASRWLFARRLVINIGLALALILVSLVGGMAGYHYIEGSGWLDAFDQTAMILGGMGPYSEPKTDGGKLFAGLYALYSGLLLIGVSGLILAPLFHRVMHYFHLPDEEDTTGGASKRVKTSSRRKA
jgi:hypothetical protein